MRPSTRGTTTWTTSSAALASSNDYLHKHEPENKSSRDGGDRPQARGWRRLGSGTAWPTLSSETGTGTTQYQPGVASVSIPGELGFLLEPASPFIL
jgi:hypothetical protein